MSTTSTSYEPLSVERDYLSIDNTSACFEDKGKKQLPRIKI